MLGARPDSGARMPIDAKTIQIFLPAGEPRGIRIAEITTRIVQAVQVPRARLDQALRRPEFDHIGAYFLFSDSGESAKPHVYVGSTEDFRTRLRSHHANRELWTTAILLLSKTDSFTLAHIRYLEWYGIQQATAAGRYLLDNGNTGTKPFITEPIEADVLDAFETGSTLLSTLGYPIFEPLLGNTGATSVLYYCRGAGAEAQGRLVEDGFVVLKGSTARPDHVPSASRYVPSKRQALLESGILVPNGSVLRFTEDYLFESPSGASQIVLGRSTNGWVEWKTQDGRTLDEVERVPGETEPLQEVVG
jgi:hypothetical protein